MSFISKESTMFSISLILKDNFNNNFFICFKSIVSDSLNNSFGSMLFDNNLSIYLLSQYFCESVNLILLFFNLNKDSFKADLYSL